MLCVWWTWYKRHCNQLEKADIMSPINLKDKRTWFKIHDLIIFWAKQNGKSRTKTQSNTTDFHIQYSLTLELSINTLWHSNILFQIKLCARKTPGREMRGEKVKRSAERKASGAEWLHISRRAQSPSLLQLTTVKYSANIHSPPVNIPCLIQLLFFTVSPWISGHAKSSLHDMKGDHMSLKSPDSPESWILSCLSSMNYYSR